MARAGRRSARRTGYYWDGLQWPATAISAGNTLFELIGPTAQEFMPGTLVRVRGHITLRPDTATDNEVVMKMMYLEVNDAGTITGDHQGIDTHEEDIAIRQLWTYDYQQGTVQGQPVTAEIDVRVKVKLSASGKFILALLADAVSGSRTSLSGYLRALILHS